MAKIVPCTVKLPRAQTPESVGVDSKVVADYVKAIEDHGFRVDSLMVYRNGKVASEHYWQPYNPDYPHDMYSFSKTVTATAIGFAIDEGLLSLDTKVYSLFPEKYNKLTGKKKEYADQMTIHSLLSMRSGKKVNMFNNTETMNWTDNFMDAPFKCAPNKKWDYVSENIYMLSKVVTMVTGQSVVDYLTPRLFEPLEMGIPLWEGDHDGVEAGGWGLQMTLEQMAKFTLVYLQNGMWDGKQVIPQSWLDVCQKKYIELVPCNIHEGTSYGYQMWLNDNPHYIRFDGLYGQISVIFPEYNAFIVFNGNDTREFEYIRMIYEYFPRAFVDGIEEKSESEQQKFNAGLVRKCYDYLQPSQRNKKMESLVSGRKIVLKQKYFASTVGVMAFFTWSKKCGSIEYIKLDFSSDVPKYIWKEKNSPENCAYIGMDGDFCISDAQLADSPFKMALQGRWEGDKFILNIHPLGRTQNRIMKFTFKGDNVKIFSEANMSLAKLLIFYLNFSGIKTPEILKKTADGIIKIANEIILDPNLKGKFEK